MIANKNFLYITNSPGEKHKQASVVLVSNLSIDIIKSYDIIFIKYFSEIKSLIRQIRLAAQIDIFLKPIVIKTGKNSAIDELLLETVDGVTNSHDFEQYYEDNLAHFSKIAEHVENLAKQKARDISAELDVATKVLKYLYTRQVSLNPFRNIKSKFGYSFPIINMFMKTASIQEFKMIEFLESKDLIEGDFRDKIHMCNFCYSAYLNIREICPKCNSANLFEENLVHHFKCGYLGPESDYSDEMCPKCHNELNHIGVDFDRPSSIVNCESCGNVFQEPEVESLCINCGKKVPAEDLLLKVIKEYQITQLGIHSVLYGLVLSVKEEFGEELELVDIENYHTILRMEIARIKRYQKSQTSIARISFQNYLEVYTQLGERAIQISHEIAKIIKSLVRSADIVSFFSEDIMVFIFPETDAQGAETVISRIKQELENLISESVNLKVNFKSKIIPVQGKQKYKDLFRRLTQDV